ncbi:uncharacterized protein LOC142640256 [Castanea sativa]|uniref:uncharacterized protein LOC142640256 n=1 Tax=Castanea sativa TaxID=21020 RepID=UPI003F651C1A
MAAVDYFTKWIKAEALANILDVDVKKFVWKNIVTWFGVPESLVSVNGLQFDSKAFCKYCSDLSIKNRYSTPAYPQSNNQAKAMNKVIVNGLKKRNCQTFYGYTEQPREGQQVLNFSLANNVSMMSDQLDLLEEHREATMVHMANYQEKLARRYNQGVKVRDFVAGDLVLRKVVGSARDVNARKLAPNWEGPYRVIAIVSAGVYYLEDMEERPLPRS